MQAREPVGVLMRTCKSSLMRWTIRSAIWPCLCMENMWIHPCNYESAGFVHACGVHDGRQWHMKLRLGLSSKGSPTNAEANRLKPTARPAMLPCPGLVTAVANTTETSVKVMMASHQKSCAVVIGTPFVWVKQPGPVPPPTTAVGKSPVCTINRLSSDNE